MRIDAERLRGFLDCMHEEADERDKRTAQISQIVKAAKEAGFDTKAVRKVFARERMDEGERARQDDLLETYEGALGGKGRALQAIREGMPVGEAAEKYDVHRATLARARHVANGPSNATTPPHDPTTGEITDSGVEPPESLATGQAPAGEGQPTDTAAGSPVANLSTSKETDHGRSDFGNSGGGRAPQVQPERQGRSDGDQAADGDAGHDAGADRPAQRQDGDRGCDGGDPARPDGEHVGGVRSDQGPVVGLSILADPDVSAMLEAGARWNSGVRRARGEAA